MDWLLALCIAAAFVIGMGLLLVIGFASGEDSSVVQNARVITGLKERNLDLVNMLGEQIKHAEDLQTRLKESESIRSQYAYHIRELSKELGELRRKPKDFALDA